MSGNIIQSFLPHSYALLFWQDTAVCYFNRYAPGLALLVTGRRNHNRNRVCIPWQKLKNSPRHFNFYVRILLLIQAFKELFPKLLVSLFSKAVYCIGGSASHEWIIIVKQVSYPE